MSKIVSDPDTEPASTGLSLSSLQSALNRLDGIDETADLKLVELSQGEVLFEQGDSGDSAFVLIAGALGVRFRHEDGTESIIDKLAPGALVGEMALVSGQPRTATVYALVDSGLLVVKRSDIEKLAAEEEGATGDLSETIITRKQRLQLSPIIHNLFGDIDTASIHAIQDRLSWHHLSNGDVLFERGDEADEMYIVLDGRLRVLVFTASGEQEIMTEIGPGESVGEYALLTDEKRPATVVAMQETEIVRLSSSDFEALADQYPKLTIAFARLIVERQQQQLGGLFPHP